ncbi:hypothetical protein U9M48_034574, partial [Paspalum notatum var. saurae]
MLAILITRAKDHGQIRGLIPHLVDEGLSILQYADDTILFMEHDLEQAKNMKLILCAFEKLSGLKINFHKSELFCYGEVKDFAEQYSEIFGCDHFQKKLSGWKGKILSYGGRLVLINSVLSSLAMFMMSFFEVPKGIIKKLYFYRSTFFWQGDNHKKKCRLAKWKILCLPKDQGGLSIRNLEIHNTCLLSKWLFRLINEDGVWQNILKKKYLRGKAIGAVKWKLGDSHFWSGLMKVKERFLELSTFNLHEGSQIRFWEDRWFGNYPLKDLYPSLYNITRKRHITVATESSSRGQTSVSKIALVQLDDQSDSIKWNLSKLGLFTVNSMYKHLVNQTALPINKYLWKLKLPLKIKIFVWFLFKGVILTKDNLFKRNWSGDGSCCFCDTNETIQLLFFDCPVARFVWRVFTVTFKATYWTRHWISLQNKAKRSLLKWACRSLETIAMEVFAKHGWPSSRRITFS